MTRDDIIKMASEAELSKDGFGAWLAMTEDLERFAQLVAEHEREACARVCEAYMEIFPDFGEYCKGGINGLTSAAKAIRARGQQSEGEQHE